MSADLADTPCPACNEPVFEKGNVVLCSRCDAYQHLRCWTAAHRCAATQKCKGKPVPVAVVKLAPPGPTANEVADVVEARTQELLHPLVADLRSSMAHGEDVESLRAESAQSAAQIRESVESLRRDVEARLERVRHLAAAIDARAAALPPPLERGDLSRAAVEIREGSGAALQQLGASVEGSVAEIRRAIAADLREVLLAVEACRWDTGSRRHPLPWDDRSDDVLAPRAAGGTVQ